MTPVCSTTTATPYGGEVAKPYWQTLVDAVEALGIAIDDIVIEDSEPVSVPQYLALFAKGVSQCPGFGLNVGRSVTLRTYPILGMTLLCCQTLKQVLEQIVRYESLNHDLGASRIVEGESESRYTWTPNQLYLPNYRDDLSFQLVLSIFAGIQTFSPWLLKQNVPIEAIGFMAPAPENYSLYQNFFKIELLFNQQSNFIAVKNEVLALKVEGADIAAFPLLTSHADKLLQGHPQNIVLQLKSILPDAFRQQCFHIEDLAGQLNVSTRTLQRKLKDAGTGFQAVLDEVRKRLAEYYLLENKLSMNEIAFLIGYKEQSSFNHTFKAWNGISPTEYRNRNIS